MKVLRIALALLVFVPPATHAKDFFVDPENGSTDGDGSSTSPWKSLQEVVDNGLIESQEWESLPYEEGKKLVPKNQGAPVKAGDTIWLRTGYYGELSITGYYNLGPITIAAQDGHEPRFRKILIRSSSNWVLRGLHVSPEFGEGELPRTMIDLDAHNFRGPIHDITVEDCVLFSTEDSSSWTADDWNERSANGISVDGTRMTIRRNVLKNVNFGISVGASHSLVEYNLIENFAGDGMRGLGITLPSNTIRSRTAMT